MSPLSLCFVKLFSDWLLSIRDNGSHVNIHKKSDIASRSKSHCERSHAICERSHANFKQRIACDLRVANEVEMGLKKSIFKQILKFSSPMAINVPVTIYLFFYAQLKILQTYY